MRRDRVRFLLTFLAGVLATAIAGVFAGSGGSFAATSSLGTTWNPPSVGEKFASVPSFSCHEPTTS